MMKLTKFSNLAAAICTVVMLTFLVGCEKPGELTITASAAKTEKAPDELKDKYTATDAEPPKVIRPPDFVETKAILLNEIDGCKTYAVRGEINYFDKSRGRWSSDYVSTYFTKCEADNKVVSKWSVKEGKRTVEKSIETIRE